MAEEKFAVGTPVISKGTFYGASGEVVGDYSDCGRPELRQVMFGSGPGRFSVTMRIDDLRKKEERKMEKMKYRVGEDGFLRKTSRGMKTWVRVTTQDGRPLGHNRAFMLVFYPHIGGLSPLCPEDEEGVRALMESRKAEREMKTQITISYEGKECPLTEKGLRVDTSRACYVIEPHLFEVVAHDEEKQEVIVALEIPEGACRFLGHSDGSPPACYGFGNPAASGGPWHMEDCYPGQAPDIICFHCAEYAGEREERQQERSERLDDHGVLELLPELSQAELGKYADDPPFYYVDRATGEIV